MPTDHDSIVEALRAIARGHDTIAGLNSGSRRWVMHTPAEPDNDPDLVLSSALGKAQAAIESLVAENARLREAMGRLDVRASDLTKAVRECADDRYIQRNLPILHGYLVGLLAEYPPTVAEQRALKGDD